MTRRAIPMTSALRIPPGFIFAMVCALAPSVSPAAETAAPDGASFQTPGVDRNLPAMRDAMVARLEFPLSWTAGKFTSFAEWRALARGKFREALLASPPVLDFAPVVIAEEDRGTHVARKVVLHLTGDSRVLALMTVPKGAGPFPAVLLLHDHGARFDIGKEKVIKPFASDGEKLTSAQEWVERGYGGRFLGDELARRGYVCFATDALNWSDRGGGGYEGQQAIASNLFNLGSSFAGLIAWEDLRAAEFLATRPEVDGRRVAALGWSLGGFRAWQTAALSEHIAAAATICWMSTVEAQLAVGSNQTRGQSAFTMTHPGLFAQMDYPDLASIACPKPMLFFSGQQDRLFTAESVAAANAKMRRVWESQNAGAHLVTKVWDRPHVFDGEMQDAAFAWLDLHLRPKER